MTKHARLYPIPGNERHPHHVAAEREESMKAIAFDTMRKLPCAAACDVVEAYFEALPLHMIDAARLDDLANMLGRKAHEAVRHKET